MCIRDSCTLVERQAERLERVDDHLHAALYLTLAVGVLNTQIKYLSLIHIFWWR